MATAVQDTQDAALGLTSPPAATETTGLSRRSPPPPAPVTLSQAEEGSVVTAATATKEKEEKRRKAEAKERIEGGGAAAVFGISTLFGCLFFPIDARHANNNVSFSICLFVAFATCVSGKALVLLSMNMLGLRPELVSGGQHIAAKCLVISCAAFSLLTLLSLVALPRRRLHRYIGIAAVTVVLLPATGVYWYLRRRTGGGGDEAAYNDDEHKEELEAASKITSCVTNSAFGGLVGVLFGAAAAGDIVDRAACVASFFMFATALLGMFVMMLSKKQVPGITKPPGFWRLFVTVIRLTNALLLCSLACAGFAAAFVILRHRVFAAFAPLIVSGIVSFLLRYCVAGRSSAAGEPNIQQERFKAIEDLASKVTTATFGGIMSVLGASIGQKDSSKKQAGARDMFMIVLTSAFVSGLGFMLLAAAPASAKVRLAPAANVLVWSSVALFAATAVAVYGMEVWTL